MVTFAFWSLISGMISYSSGLASGSMITRMSSNLTFLGEGSNLKYVFPSSFVTYMLMSSGIRSYSIPFSTIALDRTGFRSELGSKLL